jgi:hypothetical protein
VGKWSKLYSDLNLINKNEFIKINPPATEKQLSEVEEALGNKLPADLRDYLLEMNGDDWLIFSTDDIIKDNLYTRGIDYYMPLNCFLFFGRNGSGDYYGYPITSSDGVQDFNVFMWEHEDDSRIWKANNLEDTIRKYYSNEI